MLVKLIMSKILLKKLLIEILKFTLENNNNNNQVHL